MISEIPFATQLAPRTGTTQSTQCPIKIVLLHFDKMTERQSQLMKLCQDKLCHNLIILMRRTNELESLPRDLKLFLIPCRRDDLIQKIRSKFSCALIYTPKAVLDALVFFKTRLLPRTLNVSLAMFKCRIFLVKSCNETSIRRKISEMSGNLASSFENNVNIVVTDRADDKYCLKAYKLRIPVVSRDWVEDNYKLSLSDDESDFSRDARDTIDEHRVKPFYGLRFKISADNAAYIRHLITANQGRIIYGDESITHHVVPKGSTQDKGSIDLDFIEACNRAGHFIGKDYKQSEDNADENRLNKVVDHKVEIKVEPKPVDHNIDAMVLRAISDIDPAQTQVASTQMRRIPDRELSFQRPSYEPSQQLFWNDSSRKN